MRTPALALLRICRILRDSVPGGDPLDAGGHPDDVLDQVAEVLEEAGLRTGRLTLAELEARRVAKLEAEGYTLTHVGHNLVGEFGTLGPALEALEAKLGEPSEIKTDAQGLDGRRRLVVAWASGEVYAWEAHPTHGGRWRDVSAEVLAELEAAELAEARGRLVDVPGEVVEARPLVHPSAEIVEELQRRADAATKHAGLLEADGDETLPPPELRASRDLLDLFRADVDAGLYAEAKQARRSPVRGDRGCGLCVQPITPGELFRRRTPSSSRAVHETCYRATQGGAA